MRIFLTLTLFSIALFLTACADTLPTPGSGTTIAKMPAICSTVHQRFNKNPTDYYVKSKQETMVIKKCHFEAADVYFSRSAWNSLMKTLKKYPSNTAIRPMFYESNPNIRYIDKFLLATNYGYGILNFEKNSWKNIYVH